MSKAVDYRILQQKAAAAERSEFGSDSLIVCDNLVKI